MRTLLKIAATPVMIVLTLFVWCCTAALYCIAYVSGLAGTILGILGLAVLLLDSWKNGCIVLLVAFLISPYGIPMAAAWLLGKVQGMRCLLRSRVYG